MSKKSRKPIVVSTKKSYFSTRNFIILLVISLAITYGSTLNFGYTYFDDDAIVVRNENYISNIKNLPESMVRDAEFQKQSVELYRPLQNISFIIDSQLFGINPKAFHFTNFLIHFLTIIILFFLLHELGIGKRTSFVGALIYAVHPMFAYTVAWIPARGDLLLGLFGLLTIFFYLKYLKSHKNKFLIFHFVAFAFALLAKESAVMIPLIVWSYWAGVDRRFKFNTTLFLQAGVYLLLIAIYLYLRSLAIVSVSGGNFGFAAFWANLPSFPETLLKFFLPINIVLLPFFETGRTLAGAFIIIGLLALLFRTIKQEINLKIWGLIYLLILILPGMAYDPNWSEYIYSYLIHRSYFPFMGLFVFLLILLKPSVKKLNSSMLTLSSGVVIIILMALSFSFSKTFESPKSFWKAAVKTNPKSAFSHAYLGNVYLMNNKLNKALESYDEALKIKPDLKSAIINHGVANLQLNHLEASIADFKSYLKLDSGDVSAKKYLAEAYYKTDNYKQAYFLYNQLNDKALMDEGMKYNYGMSSFFIKDYEKSFGAFKSLLDSHPDNLNYIRTFAMAALMSGNIAEAITKNELLIRKKKEDYTSLCNLGYAYWEGELYQKAVISFQKAAKIEPDDIDVNLGLTLCYSSLNEDIKLDSVLAKVYNIKAFLRHNPEGISRLEAEGFVFTDKQKIVLEKALGE